MQRFWTNEACPYKDYETRLTKKSNNNIKHLHKKLNVCFFEKKLKVNEVKKGFQLKPQSNKLACFSLEKTWAQSLMRLGNKQIKKNKDEVTKKTFVLLKTINSMILIRYQMKNSDIESCDDIHISRICHTFTYINKTFRRKKIPLNFAIKWRRSR